MLWNAEYKRPRICPVLPFWMSQIMESVSVGTWFGLKLSIHYCKMGTVPLCLVCFSPWRRTKDSHRQKDEGKGAASKRRVYTHLQRGLQGLQSVVGAV